MKKARLGLIVPSSNTTMEEEFRLLLPKGITLHTSRMRLVNVIAEELFNMAKSAKVAALELLDADVDIIVYGCTTGSLIGGVGYDEQIAENIKDATGRNTVVTATSIIHALKKLNVVKVSLSTPYTDDLTRAEQDFLEKNGFEVVNSEGLGIVSNLEIGLKSPDDAYGLACQSDVEAADCVFISCTNLRTFEMLEHAEKNFRKPVISSNQATLWSALKELGVKEQIRGYGSLFQCR